MMRVYPSSTGVFQNGILVRSGAAAERSEATPSYGKRSLPHVGVMELGAGLLGRERQQVARQMRVFRA